MANNLFANTPAACVANTAAEAVTFVDAGFTALNCRIIYEVGSPLKSYVPGRPINAVVQFTAGKGYYIIPILDLDMTAYLIPPIVGGGGVQTPAAPTVGVVDDTADTFNWTNNPLFPDVSDYETTVNGGGAWSTATAKPFAVGNVAKAIGQVGVRVKAVGGNNPSAGLFNATAFNLGGSGFEAETDTMIAAQSLTDSAAKTRLNNLVVAAKAIGLSKFKAIWPLESDGISQTRAFQQKFNLLNPLNTDAAFRLTFTNCANNSRGFVSTGFGFANTHFIPATHGINDDFGQGVFSSTDTNQGIDMGGNDGTLTNALWVRAAGIAYSQIQGVTASTGLADGIGLSDAYLDGNADHRYYHDATLLDTQAIAHPNTLTTVELYWGGRNNQGTMDNVTEREYKFGFISVGLTPSERAAWRTAIQTYCDAKT
jgi:hypothetical protein